MSKIFEGCPGAVNIRGTPTLEEKICPDCGRVIEMFSVDTQVPCECGFTAYNEIQNCINWCKYARECVGETAAKKLHGSSKK